MEESNLEVKSKELRSREKELEKSWHRRFFLLTRELGNLVNPTEADLFLVYYPFLGAILDYAKLSQPSAKLEEFKNEIDNSRLRAGDLAEEKARELVEMAPLKGMDVLEIGGPFVQVLHLLGAQKAVCIDPAFSWPYNPEREGYERIFKRFDFTKPREHVGEENFDIVLTREVLSTGSQLISEVIDLGRGEAVVHKFEFGRKNTWSDNEIYQGMLEACTQLTKKGGLNIHGGDCVEQEDEFYRRIGLRSVAQSTSLNTTTFVFKKE